jgi:hypothetical protein
MQLCRSLSPSEGRPDQCCKNFHKRHEKLQSHLGLTHLGELGGQSATEQRLILRQEPSALSFMISLEIS